MTVPLPPDFWEAGPVLPFPALFYFEPQEERMEELQIVYLSPHDLTPYEGNARKHGAEDIEQIKQSIEMDGFNDPIGIWGDDNLIVEGHGRQIAAIELHMDKVPCIRLDHLTDAQRRDYAIRHNRTAELSGWDWEQVEKECEALDLEGFDTGDLFNFEAKTADWFDREQKDGKDKEDGNDEYNDFVEKFEPKKTTDDCYTPEVVYDAIAEWVASRYGVKRSRFMRPFYPGGDYTKEAYKPDSVVVDNPPFSILAEIVKFYDEHGIKFFLFAPTLTLFSSASACCAICTGVTITYENGANVNTSFLTNLDEGTRARSEPTLYAAVKAANDENLREQKKELPRYLYPDYVLTSTRCAQFSRLGIDFVLPKAESEHIRCLDAQKEADKAAFGSAYLMSERMKQEKEKAEREKAERWHLSPREMEIVRRLGGE